MSRGLVVRNGKLTVSESVVRANMEFDRAVRAGEICPCCGVAFGTYSSTVKRVVNKDKLDPTVCDVCAPDFR